MGPWMICSRFRLVILLALDQTRSARALLTLASCQSRCIDYGLHAPHPESSVSVLKLSLVVTRAVLLLCIVVTRAVLQAAVHAGASGFEIAYIRVRTAGKGSRNATDQQVSSTRTHSEFRHSMRWLD